jgi:hypothetical protein
MSAKQSIQTQQFAGNHYDLLPDDVALHNPPDVYVDTNTTYYVLEGAEDGSTCTVNVKDQKGNIRARTLALDKGDFEYASVFVNMNVTAGKIKAYRVMPFNHNEAPSSF